MSKESFESIKMILNIYLLRRAPLEKESSKVGSTSSFPTRKANGWPKGLDVISSSLKE